MGLGQSSQSKEQLLNSEIAEKIKQTVAANCVVMYSKTTCPYCRMAKKVFDDIGTEYKVIELNKMSDGSQYQDVLNVITGTRTVPRVFINGECIGGGSETKALHQSGQLVPMLNQCQG